MSQFTKEYFIEKFTAIPDDLWTITQLTDDKNPNCHCALGHCGVKEERGDYIMTDEANALGKILRQFVERPLNWENVYVINDGFGKFDVLGNHPKERVINALNLLNK